MRKDARSEQTIRLTAFISYSREDEAFARALARRLQAAGLDVKADWLLEKGEDYLQQLRLLIVGSDVFVALLSPDYVASEACTAEVATAQEMGKRMLPIAHRDHGDDARVAASLRAIHWTFMRAEADFDSEMPAFVQACCTDLGWLVQHRQLLVAADNWRSHGMSRAYLLRGDALVSAERWMVEAGTQGDRLPRPTSEQSQLVMTSQQARRTGVCRRLALAARGGGRHVQHCRVRRVPAARGAVPRVGGAQSPAGAQL